MAADAVKTNPQKNCNFNVYPSTKAKPFLFKRTLLIWRYTN
ncbi:MAG: hypothetical protein ACI9RL_001669, partial [Candidatus Paceibacteria bacterium]